ncbi:class I SAM-dependent methyltransferase [Adhaeribacter sp. BT258]|uniref:Class I SAM-dependent methyltransferase n=1 Tax=Adhaeribacter terrigena TaxID=2793070 RepID=A0ABS1C1F7_9BACT|nr:class I SAM-dependent methyltransferase [Adhaeribacter terrigena]MBK0403243.1 class I SAM-dependent methyltransferase [Adhaeribacter terrigena]
MNPYQTTFETWNKVALAYQEKFMELDLYNDTYDAFCELIQQPRARIFEIGCGPGNITKYLLAQRPDFRIEAIDVAPNMLELARTNNPAAIFKQLDCREIDTISGTFDGVVCGFAMPYLSQPDCAKLVKDCAALLPAGGIFYGSVIEGNYEQSGYEANSAGHKMYVYYYQESFLEAQLQQNNFETVRFFRKKLPKADGTTSTHLIFIARKTSAA